MRTKLFVLVLCATLMMVTVPSAIGQWEQGSKYRMDPEPNFGAGGSHDTDATKMWQTAPNALPSNPDPIEYDDDGVGVKEDRLYIDLILDTEAITTPGVAIGPGQGPAPGVIDNFYPLPYPETDYYAYFGYWRDCNGDGYMGDIDTMAQEYPADGTEPFDPNLCPDPSTPGAEDRDRFFNDGAKIREFIPVGPNVRDINAATLTDFGTGNTLCPDRDGGPANKATTDGDQGGTARSKDSSSFAHSGGDNVYCGGGTTSYIQDNYAKVWMDLLLPNSPPKPTGSFCFFEPVVFACDDGTYRDSNGAFRAIDGTVLGAISKSTFGLWPNERMPAIAATATDNDDPTRPAQCDKHKDPVFGPDSSDVTHLNPTGMDTDHGDGENQYSDDGNAISNAASFVSQTPGSGDDAPFPGCTPIPNFAYVTLPVTGPVAYPYHLVEDRFNSSEKANEMENEGIAGEPFYWRNDPQSQSGSTADDPDETGNTVSEAGSGNRCELNTNPSSWDGESDADPIGGGDPTAPSNDPDGDGHGFVQEYVGPHDTGPSINPTFRSVFSGALYQIDRAGWQAAGGEQPQCRSQGGLVTWESHSATAQDAAVKGPGSEDPTASGTGQETFFEPLTFNPNRDLGVGNHGSSFDQDTCIPNPAFDSSIPETARCKPIWFLAAFIDVPNEQPLVRSYFRTAAAVVYGDVSFGDGSGNVDCTPGAALAGGASADCTTTSNSVNTFDPAGNGQFKLGPAGVYDATNPGWDGNAPWQVSLFTPDEAAAPGGNDAHSYGDEGCLPSTDTSGATADPLTGGEQLALKPLPSTPQILDVKNNRIVANPGFDANTGPPAGWGTTTGSDYFVEPTTVPKDDDPNTPLVHDGVYWSCDRSFWLIKSAISVTFEDPNDPSKTVTEPGCNIWRWSDANGDTVIQADEVTPPPSERECYILPKVGDPYDVRDFECIDSDNGALKHIPGWTGQTYQDINNNVPDLVENAIFGGPDGTSHESLYFDCDTPNTGVPSP